MIAGYVYIAVRHLCQIAIQSSIANARVAEIDTLAAHGKLLRPHHDPLGWSRLLATSVDISLTACNIIPEWSLPSQSLWSGACIREARVNEMQMMLVEPLSGQADSHGEMWAKCIF